MSLRLSDPMDFTPPPLHHLQRSLWLHRQWLPPQSFGLENLDPVRPALYVGNHTLYGVLDGPMMVLDVYEKTGIFLRSLGDHIHFMVPGWREMLLKGGTVDGIPENCSKLMNGSQHFIVYPGGAREVMKNDGEQYRLVWKRRTGFARMAMQHGYDIIPFAALGGDDAFAIRYDSQRFRGSLLGKVAEKTGVMDALFRGGDTFGPFVKGVAGTTIPHPEKLYFMFGKRIPTAHLQADHGNIEAQWAVRKQVASAIYQQIDELKAIRSKDTDWSWWRKKLIGRVGQ